MRWTRWIALSFSIAAMAAAVTLVAHAQTKKAVAPSKQTLERGRYLSIIGQCNDCHTPGTLYGSPDFERELSGSDLGWQGPWGVSYARNLTSDPETGLGKWTEDQIVNTLKTGVHPDGHVLLPPMPWPNTSQSTDADLRALAAYIKSLKPVVHAVPKAIPPGQPVTGTVIVLPPPPAWDAPRTPPDTAGKK